DRLAPVAVLHLLPGLVMNVDDLGIGDVGKPAAAGLDGLGPGEVLEAGQALVVGLLLPDRAANGAVGVVAEVGRLRTDRAARKPAREDLALGELVGLVSGLTAIGEHDALV